MMFCLGEESIAGHLGERKPREEITGGEEEELPALTKAQSSISSVLVSVEGGEDEDYKVVQVGEKAREHQDDKPKQQQQQQPEKKKQEPKAQKGGKELDYNKAQNAGAVVRGKHSKIKKMKEKYGD